MLLHIAPQHAVRVEELPQIHKDPFDRLLVAQAMLESLVLITMDPVVARYNSAIMQVA